MFEGALSANRDAETKLRSALLNPIPQASFPCGARHLFRGEKESQARAAARAISIPLRLWRAYSLKEIPSSCATNGATAAAGISSTRFFLIPTPRAKSMPQISSWLARNPCWP